MSHFEELSQLYDVWHKKWFEDYIEHKRLSFHIAHEFRKFLGAPEAFDGKDDTGSPTRIKYVSAARAIRQPDEKFTLSVEDPSDIEFEEDGSFYFGLRLMMESAPNTLPKHPFWFLLHGKFHGDYFDVQVKRTSEEFKLGSDDAVEMQRLCEHLLEQLKLEMIASPLARRSPEPMRIGFGPPPTIK